MGFGRAGEEGPGEVAESMLREGPGGTVTGKGAACTSPLSTSV